MRPSLGNDGEWIYVLLEEQHNAHTFTDEEVYSLFPPETLGRDYSMELDPPVRIGTNVIQEEDDDQVDDPPLED